MLSVTHIPRLAHAYAFVVAAGALLTPVAFGAAPPVSRSDGVPIPGKVKGCREQGPKVLRVGREPRAPLRLDLSKIASTRIGQVDLERIEVTVRRADHKGRTLHTHGTRKLSGVLTTHTLHANGRLPISAHFTLTFPGAVHPKPPHSTFGLNGYVDALNGGALGTTLKGAGGTPITDRLPGQAVGVGATWRVVNCDAIASIPAKETRVYTLRSVANGIISATFRDDIEIDPAATKLASQKVGGTKVTVRLRSLHGSAKGAMSIPEANGLAEHERTASHLSYSTETSTSTAAGTIVKAKVIDIDTQSPTR
jgi:hypothetical protein